MTAIDQAMAYTQLPEAFYSEIENSQFPKASLFKLNTALASNLGLDKTWLQSTDGLNLLSGQSTISGEKAIAMAYGGHQFGHWSGLLGDGRARLVGEVYNQTDCVELHLKGAGRTPYSRQGDGKATLGSTIREYIVSEAMAALGVPTTRSLSIVLSGENIQRQKTEQGAILCRTAQSHIRVGTFEYAAALGNTDHLKALADFSIERLYPDAPKTGHERYRYFLNQVIQRQAALIAKWMGFGFIHGVMNTDNMCISGETIDYGPCAFMDNFHPEKRFSSIDRHGRYAWNNQPEMAFWNLSRFADTLAPLLSNTPEEQQTAAKKELETFIKTFQNAFTTIMASKFGLTSTDQSTIDQPTIDIFLSFSFPAMAQGEVDFTLFFHELTKLAAGGDKGNVLNLFQDQKIGETWLEKWLSVTGGLKTITPETLERMNNNNPVIIPRNHRIEQAIQDANSGDYSTFETLLTAVTQPFTPDPENLEFTNPPKENEVVKRTYCGT